MRPGGFSSSMLVGFVALVLIIAGCGKKDYPVPPQARVGLPAVIADLSSVSIREGIRLSWSLPIPTDSVGSFKILRSEALPGSEDCPGCPRDLRPLRTVRIGNEQLQREGGKNFHYLDIEVRDDLFYTYRVAICDRAGYCGEASNEVNLVHKGR